MPQFSALRSVPNLKSIPSGLQHVTALRKLEISDCPNLTIFPELTSVVYLRISRVPQPNINSRWDYPFFSQFLLGYLKNTSPLSLDHATCNITSDLMGLIIEIYSLETLRISETDLAQNIGRLGI
ncbi:hypothetical protein CMV_025074 [Castanea mollissima]|uniref:Disease resistance protein n=1 Tax=Castanea mollissima TaxID=60419 RepID=A0A8J4QMM4_9ROSI|nr:hypothetical protein CMV_025074 [Castanea mollissima]